MDCTKIAGEDPSVFVLKSFTKMYAMPGLRFGYAICADVKLLEQMRSGMQPWNVSLPAQAAARAAASEVAFAKKDGTAGRQKPAVDDRKAAGSRCDSVRFGDELPAAGRPCGSEGALSGKGLSDP